MLGDYQQLKCVADFEIFNKEKDADIDDLITAAEDVENDNEGDQNYEDVENDQNHVTNKQMENLIDMNGVEYENEKINETLKKQNAELKGNDKKESKKRELKLQYQRYYRTLYP